LTTVSTLPRRQVAAPFMWSARRCLVSKGGGQITTHKDASAVALSQVKAHIDAGKAVIAGVNIPAVT
jgi:hypothetical protein